MVKPDGATNTICPPEPITGILHHKSSVKNRPRNELPLNPGHSQRSERPRQIGISGTFGSCDPLKQSKAPWSRKLRQACSQTFRRYSRKYSSRSDRRLSNCCCFLCWRFPSASSSTAAFGSFAKSVNRFHSEMACRLASARSCGGARKSKDQFA